MSTKPRTRTKAPAARATRSRSRKGTDAGVRVRRVYEQADPAADGARILVDRVWPRGIKKEDARLDAWEKDVAPSTELRKWYGHDPDRFEEFAGRYLAELDEPGPARALDRLRERAAEGSLTLLTATKDAGLSQAEVLAQTLRGER